MRPFTLALLFSLATFYSVSANAYLVWNMTGISATFYGEDCANCMKKTIPNGEYGFCPGNVAGCRGETEIYIKGLPEGYQPSYFGVWNYSNTFTQCPYVPVKVTSAGIVEAYKDHVLVTDNTGKILYNGPWVGKVCVIDHAWAI